MVSRQFLVGVIGKRFGYTAANASAIVDLLNEADRELVESAARRACGSVEIAAIIMAARTRAAEDVRDPRQRALALLAAQEEAARHHRRILDDCPLPNSYPDAAVPRRAAGVRVVRVADVEAAAGN